MRRERGLLEASPTSFPSNNHMTLHNNPYIRSAFVVGVERDFVFYQEFLIPGASVGILECTHFSELFGYNYTR